MSIDVLDRVALRALDPALVGGLSQSERDAVAEAIMIVWQRFYPFCDVGLCDAQSGFCLSHATSARVAAPRCERAFLSSGDSSALLLPTSGKNRCGS